MLTITLSFLPPSKILPLFLSLVLLFATPLRASSNTCSHALKRALTYKNHTGAIESLGPKKCPLERKIVAWHFMKSGSHKGDFKTYKNFSEHHKDWPWIFQIRRAADDLLENEGPQTIQEWFKERSPKTFDGAKALIHSSLQLNDKDTAHQVAKKLWIDLDLPKSLSKTYLDHFGGFLTEQDHFLRARHWLAKGKTIPALEAARYVSNKSDRLVLEAQIALLKNTPKARALYNKAKVHRKKDYALQLSYLQWLRRTYNDYAAQYLLRHPEMVRFAPEQSWKEAHILLRRALEKGNTAQATSLAKAHALTKGPSFAEAQWLKAWLILWHDQNPHKARQLFTAGYQKVGTPISRARFAFWAGLATEGDNATAAKEWYKRAAQNPGTFYGQQALQKLGYPGVPPLPSLTAKKSLVARFKKTPLFKAAATLLKAEHPRQAQSFLHMLMKTAQNKEEENAVLKAVMDLSPEHLVGIGKEASPTRDLYYKELYPVLSKRHHQAYNAVDPALFHAVVRKESLFDSQLVSWAGALGLSQLLPATAQETAKKLRVPFKKEKLLKDATYNSKIGATYLASRLEKFDGNVPLGLVAYNAGIKHAYDWQELFGDPRQPSVNLIHWMESLPFGETRNYLQRVLENQAVYRCILDKKCAR